MAQKYFLNVTKGGFNEKIKPGVKGASFESITGYLVNVAFKETDFGDAMRLHVVGEENFYMLSMFVQSRPANAFFMLAQNLMPQYEMTLKMKSVNGKDYFSIDQFGGPVLWYYTKENQHDLPLLPEDRRGFLLNMMETDFIPALQKNLNPYPNHLLYKPMRKGLQGGYFDEFKSNSRVLGPLSHAERNGFK